MTCSFIKPSFLPHNSYILTCRLFTENMLLYFSGFFQIFFFFFLMKNLRTLNAKALPYQLHIFTAMLYWNFTSDWKHQSHKLLKKSSVPNKYINCKNISPYWNSRKICTTKCPGFLGQQIPLANKHVHSLLPRSSKISPISMKHGSARESLFPSTSSP